MLFDGLIFSFRSHSERSLAEFKKDQAKEASSSAASFPFVSSLTSSLSLSTENTTASSRNLSASTSITDTVGGTPLRSSDTLTNFLHETIDTIKLFLGKADSKPK